MTAGERYAKQSCFDVLRVHYQESLSQIKTFTSQAVFLWLEGWTSWEICEILNHTGQFNRWTIYNGLRRRAISHEEQLMRQGVRNDEIFSQVNRSQKVLPEDGIEGLRIAIQRSEYVPLSSASTIIEGLDLTGINLRDLMSGRFPDLGPYANTPGFVLCNIWFHDCIMKRMNFKDLPLYSVQFHNCDLSGSNLSLTNRTTYNAISFFDCNLVDTSLDGRRIGTIDNCLLSGATCKNTSIKFIKFRKVKGGRKLKWKTLADNPLSGFSERNIEEGTHIKFNQLLEPIYAIVGVSIERILRIGVTVGINLECCYKTNLGRFSKRLTAPIDSRVAGYVLDHYIVARSKGMIDPAISNHVGLNNVLRWIDTHKDCKEAATYSCWVCRDSTYTAMAGTRSIYKDIMNFNERVTPRSLMNFIGEWKSGKYDYLFNPVS
jgi:hypothetical protein